ncbi:MAG: GLUG motif-containing protein [Planctomycetota bacterium]|jgi:hypothetical protein
MSIKKRFRMSLAVSVFLLATFSVAHAQYSGGSGTADDLYQIATAADLIALGETPDDYDKHFILTADIDLDPNLPGRKVFDRAVIAPISVTSGRGGGNYIGKAFSGFFNGQGYEIRKLYIRGQGCLGLFGSLDREASIINLGMRAVNIYGTGGPIGGLVGHNIGHISSSYSNGKVSGINDVGGLVGSNVGLITSSCSTGSVIGERVEIGGLVGLNAYGGYISISYSTSTITGENLVGGLVGHNIGHISSSYSNGKVSGINDVGGLVGENWNSGSITNSYSSCKVDGERDVGGLVGSNRSGSITSSFWDIVTSNRTTMCGMQEGNATGCDDTFGKTTS